MTTRVWYSAFSKRTRSNTSRFYLHGYSHAHSRKVWRELPDDVRRVNQHLRDSTLLASMQTAMPPVNFNGPTDKWRARFRIGTATARAFYGSTGK